MKKFANVVWKGVKSKVAQILILLIVGFFSGALMSAKKYLTIPAQVESIEQCTNDIVENMEKMSTKDELDAHVAQAALRNNVQDAEIKANRDLMESIERQNKETIRLLQQIYENVK